MKFVNCTPHSITLLDRYGNVMQTLPKGDVVPRLSQSIKKVDVVDVVEGILIKEIIFGDVQDLPDAREGILLIVSRLILDATRSRKDLVVPNELVRDLGGNIVGCKSLARN